MIWVDREVEKIIERGLSLEWVDDMKTTSGRIHVGALRGVVIHDLLYKVLLENNKNARFSYIFNDMDPMDAIPSYLDYEKWERYAGMPLYKIPSPESGHDSFAKYFADEFIEVFESINCHPEIIWSSKLYESGKMNGVIKEALDGAEQIRDIYAKITKAPKKDDWFPFQVVCEKCKKIGTTLVYAWNGKEVSYRCSPEMVAWAQGCKHEGKISPFDGNGKLLWKIDWAAHWKVIGITVEGSGKDHMSAGGSYDISSNIAKKVFAYNPPYAPAYEWFTIGGRKMSSSKGIGVSSREVSQILPHDIFRFLIVRAPIERSLDFNPYGDTILNLFDDYDRCFNAYFDKKDGKLGEGKRAEVLSDFARIIELSEVRPLPDRRIFLPRFRTIVNLLKTGSGLLSFFEHQKGSSLTKEEKDVLEERSIFAQIYLDNYSDVETLESDKNNASSLADITHAQRSFLSKLAEELEKMKKPTHDAVSNVVYELIKKHGFKPREAFAAFYKALIGKTSGPKATNLISDIGHKTAVKKIKNLLKRV